jgi:hypothetical protein
MAADFDLPGGDDVLDSFLQTNDGLSKMAGLVGQFGGRELSPEALQVLMFLRMNGSNDLANAILHDKLYQLTIDDVTKFTKELSSATAYERQVEIQGKAFSK